MSSIARRNHPNPKCLDLSKGRPASRLSTLKGSLQSTWHIGDTIAGAPGPNAASWMCMIVLCYCDLCDTLNQWRYCTVLFS